MMNFTAKVPARVFGFESDRNVLGFVPTELANGLRNIEIDPDYVFQPDAFERMRLWWEGESTKEPLFISGPAGCGKTSMVMQFMARVNAPVVTLTCRRRMDKYELIGQWGSDPTTGQLVWIDGPATIAWRYGATLIINEPTTAPAEVWVSANDLLEGDSIVIDRTGEVVPRHPNTRVVFTDNRPLGDAAATQQYLGRHEQDASVVDRCWHLALNFPDTEEQCAMLEKKTAKLSVGLDADKAKAIIANVVEFAEFLRKPDHNGVVMSQLSQRGMIRLLEMLFAFAKAPGCVEHPFSTALSLTMTDGLAEASASSIQNVAQFDFSKIDRLVRGR